MFIAFYFTDMWKHCSAMLELEITLNTGVYWKSWCSEVLENWVGHQEPIVGEGIVVEIDESVMVRRKYNRGRPISQVWVFGEIEQGEQEEIYSTSIRWW